jgi:hypothetical protein
VEVLNVLGASESKEHCARIRPHLILRCSFIDLSTLTTMEALRKKEMNLSSPKTNEDVVALGPTA